MKTDFGKERPLSRDEAVEILARRLFENRIRLDPPVVPGEFATGWDQQTEYVRSLHREIIEDLVLYREVLGCLIQ